MFSVGSTAQQTAAAAAQHRAAVVSVDDDDEDEDGIRQVLESLVDEFLKVGGSVDRQTAQQYLVSNQMDLEAALNVYFSDQAS